MCYNYVPPDLSPTDQFHFPDSQKYQIIHQSIPPPCRCCFQSPPSFSSKLDDNAQHLLTSEHLGATLCIILSFSVPFSWLNFFFLDPLSSFLFQFLLSLVLMSWEILNKLPKFSEPNFLLEKNADNNSTHLIRVW